MNINNFVTSLTIGQLLNYRRTLNNKPNRDTIDDIVGYSFSNNTLSAKFGITEDPKRNRYYIDATTRKLVSTKQAILLVNARLNVEIDRLKGYRQQLKATPTVDKSAEILDDLAYQGYDDAMDNYPDYATHDIWTWGEMANELYDLSEDKQAKAVEDSKYSWYSFDNGGNPVGAKETIDFINTQLQKAEDPDAID